MCKFNFQEAQPFQRWIVRQLALLILDHGYALDSKWFPGDENDVSDCLSCDHHLSIECLTKLLLLHVPEQLPEHFRISPLRHGLLSSVISELHKLALPKKQGFSIISAPSNSTTIRSSSGLTSGLKGGSSELMLPRSAPCASDLPIMQTVMNLWRLHAKPPSSLWIRPSRHRPPGRDETGKLHFFYRDSCEDTQI
jgi:hypothetical protein